MLSPNSCCCPRIRSRSLFSLRGRPQVLLLEAPCPAAPATSLGSPAGSGPRWRGGGCPEPQRDGARRAAPRPAEGAAAPRRGCGARGAGPGVCVSGRPGGGARLSAPRRPPARARSPPGRCHRRPHLASEARGLRGLRGALRGPGLAAARPAASLCPGEAAGGAAAASSGGRLGVRSEVPVSGHGALRAGVAAWAVPTRGERGARAGVGGRRDPAGGPALGAGASPPPTPAPPRLAPRGKFGATPLADLLGRWAESRPVAK